MSSQDTKQPETSVPVEETKVDGSKTEEVEAVISIFLFLKLNSLVWFVYLKI